MEQREIWNGHVVYNLGSALSFRAQAESGCLLRNDEGGSTVTYSDLESILAKSHGSQGIELTVQPLALHPVTPQYCPFEYEHVCA